MADDKKLKELQEKMKIIEESGKELPLEDRWGSANEYLQRESPSLRKQSSALWDSIVGGVSDAGEYVKDKVFGAIDPASKARQEVGEEVEQVLQKPAPTPVAPVAPTPQKPATSDDPFKPMVDPFARPEQRKDLTEEAETLRSDANEKEGWDDALRDANDGWDRAVEDAVDAPKKAQKKPVKKPAPISKEEKQVVNKVANEVVKQGTVAPKDKKHFLQQLLDEYRASKSDHKERLEEAAMWDAIVNASRSFAVAAGVDKDRLIGGPSNLEDRERAKRAGNLQEILNQSKVEKQIKDLMPEEITAYQKESLQLQKDKLQLSKDAEERQAKAALGPTFKAVGKHLYRIGVDGSVQKVAGGDAGLGKDPKVLYSEAERAIRGHYGKGADEYLEAIKGMTTSQMMAAGVEAAMNGKLTTLPNRRQVMKEAAIENRNRAGRLSAAKKIVADKIGVVAGDKGARTDYIRALNRAQLTQDGLRIIEDIKAGKFKVTPQVQAELATVLASALSGGMAPSEGQVKELMPDTLAKTAGEIKQYLTSGPASSASKRIMQHWEETIRGQYSFWRGKVQSKNRIMESAVDMYVDEFPELRPYWKRAIKEQYKDTDVKGGKDPMQYHRSNLGKMQEFTARHKIAGVERDPKIEQYAEQYNLDYNRAEKILRKRGYGKK